MTVSEIAVELQVMENTVRKDLKEMNLKVTTRNMRMNRIKEDLKNKMTIKEIAQKEQITERTVWRYLELIRKS